ncbi:MAG: hypothetical protein WBO55_03340 [Rhizobiaceae bacterium]
MKQIAELAQEFFGRFSVFRKKLPVNSCEAYADFMATRSAFVAQKKLYEYVKTRMGLQYPERFRDEVFIESLNIAKWNVYAACMSDLAIWMASQTLQRTGDRAQAAQLATIFFTANAHERLAPGFEEGVSPLTTAFADRLALVDWKAAGETEVVFRHSTSELVRWSPIAPDLKKYDREIVENSLRFAWMRIREEFHHLYDHEAFMADWTREN